MKGDWGVIGLVGLFEVGTREGMEMGVISDVRGKLSVGLAEIKLRREEDGRRCEMTATVADRWRLRTEPCAGVVGLNLGVNCEDASVRGGRTSALMVGC
jgi:hypothetical protein